MSDRIHPTAIVDPRARLADDAVVGAYSIVGPDVTLDAGVELGHHVVLEGRVTVGARCRIGHGAVLGSAPQYLAFDERTPSGVRLGAGTVVREYVTVHRAITPDGWTEIGRDCLLMASSHVAHDCRLGDGVIVINAAGLAGHCDIGPRATVGGLSGLHPFTRVGEHAYIGGSSKVNADIPPYMLVDGVPATARGVNVIGLRRAGMPPAERLALQAAYRLLYRGGLAPRTALERMERELGEVEPVRRLIAFVRASRRGICGSPRTIDVTALADTAADDERVV